MKGMKTKLAKFAPLVIVLGAIILLGGLYFSQTSPTILPPAIVKLNAQLAIPLNLVAGASSCAVSGKVKVITVHSPTCPYCEAQYPMLQQLKQKYGNQLELDYVCVPIHSGDGALCQNDSSGEYLPYSQGIALATQYQSAIQGTPTLIFDCQYARVGSYAISDPTSEAADLDKIVSTLLQP